MSDPVRKLRAVERVELADLPHRLHRCWESGVRGHWRHQRFEVGELAGGWYAARTGRRGVRAWRAVSERQACEAVEGWLRRLTRASVDWRETTGQDA